MMVGIAGIIILGILAMIGCGVVMMFTLAIPVMLVNFFRGIRSPKTAQEEGIGIVGTLIIAVIMGLIVSLGIKLFEIFIPAVIEIMSISVWLGVTSAVIMSAVIIGPMISLFTYKVNKKIDDLKDRISKSDKKLDFEESHRLLDELQIAEEQYEKRKNTTINTLMIVCVVGFFLLYIFV